MTMLSLTYPTYHTGIIMLKARKIAINVKYTKKIHINSDNQHIIYNTIKTIYLIRFNLHDKIYVLPTEAYQSDRDNATAKNNLIMFLVNLLNL